MRCGLYGKLPARRDFIALGVPREFLAVWEPWIQGGISASRVDLGAEWQAAFLRAPIWRFWLGADLCGFPALGAFMPSVDGVGRYFPLTLFARPDPGEALPPPEFDGHDDWLGRAEEMLLSALGEGTTFEAVTEAFGRFLGPQPALPDLPPEAMRLRDGALLASLEPAAIGETLKGLRAADQARVYGAMTYWWTIGGDDFAPRLLVHRRMPSPYILTGMLTGRFDDRAA